MKGVLKQPENGDLYLQEGEYGKHPVNGVWYARPPGFAGTANLKSYAVVEETDGTITVSPSILLHTGPDGKDSWHGYLEHGIWRRV